MEAEGQEAQDRELRFVPGLQGPQGSLVRLTASGSAVWNALLIGAGWYLGQNWQWVSSPVGSISNVILAVALAAVVGLAVRWWRRKRV